MQLKIAHYDDAIVKTRRAGGQPGIPTTGTPVPPGRAGRGAGSPGASQKKRSPRSRRRDAWTRTMPPGSGELLLKGSRALAWTSSTRRGQRAGAGPGSSARICGRPRRPPTPKPMLSACELLLAAYGYLERGATRESKRCASHSPIEQARGSRPMGSGLPREGLRGAGQPET